MLITSQHPEQCFYGHEVYLTLPLAARGPQASNEKVYLPFCPICLKIAYVVLLGTPNKVCIGMKSIRPCPWHPGALKPSISLYPVRLELKFNSLCMETIQN